MDKNAINIIGNIIFVIMGLVLVIFHRQLAHKTTEYYYKLLHVHFSEKGYQIGFLVIGIGAVVFGLLSIFQVIKFK